MGGDPLVGRSEFYENELIDILLVSGFACDWLGR
jgi:hypothetical protein